MTMMIATRQVLCERLCVLCVEFVSVCCVLCVSVLLGGARVSAGLGVVSSGLFGLLLLLLLLKVQLLLQVKMLLLLKVLLVFWRHPLTVHHVHPSVLEQCRLLYSHNTTQTTISHEPPPQLHNVDEEEGDDDERTCCWWY